MVKESVDEWKEIFIHNVIWLRKFYGISKKRMAQLLGISVQSLNRIECGEIPPQMRIDILANISVHFHISPHRQLTERLGEKSLPF